MKISRTMLRDHLRGVTVNFFSHHNVAPDDIGDYAQFADAVKNSAERQGDLPWLKLGLEHVLTHRDKPCEDLNGGIYAFSDEQVRDLIEVVWETIWPGESLPGEGKAPEVELEEMPTDEWNKFKTKLKLPASVK
jgi:hypothetical protein